MGFGILFIGYFLLLNLTYYSFTDVIAAAVMLLALYKLSYLNRHFKLSAILSCVFLVYGLSEFIIGAFELFYTPINNPTLWSCMSISRSAIVGALSVFILLGIREVAMEVDVKKLVKKCTALIPITMYLYFMWMILELPLGFLGDYVPAVLSFITIIATIIIIIANLTAVYGAYMQICMPGDENPMKEKPSKFAFVNNYRARKAERDAEVARQRLELMRQRQERKGKKK